MPTFLITYLHSVHIALLGLRRQTGEILKPAQLTIKLKKISFLMVALPTHRFRTHGQSEEEKKYSRDLVGLNTLRPSTQTEKYPLRRTYLGG